LVGKLTSEEAAKKTARTLSAVRHHVLKTAERPLGLGPLAPGREPKALFWSSEKRFGNWKKSFGPSDFVSACCVLPF
jgi:hypothetical protein